jgi:glycosyltransferase involved in cell wall biosynthesis
VVAGVPAYNEEKNIAKVIVSVKKHVDAVVVCDDGSSDMTSEIAASLGADVITHERNLGYGAAIASLFRRARELKADVMVTIDGDGQHNPDDIPRLVGPVIAGEADAVIGSRFKDGASSSPQMPGYRKLGVKVITRSTNAISGQDISDSQSGFRAYSARALDLISPSEMGMGASVEILLKAEEEQLSVREVPTRIKYDEKPETNPVYHGAEVVLSTVKYLSIRHPILFYGIPGFILFIVGFAFGFWTLELLSTLHHIPPGPALGAVAGTTIGLLLMTTSIVLWVLVTVVKGKQQ